MFKGIKKEDLKITAEELGESTTPEIKVVDLKNLILNSAHYKDDKTFVEQFDESVISDRKLREQQASIES